MNRPHKVQAGMALACMILLVSATFPAEGHTAEHLDGQENASTTTVTIPSLGKLVGLSGSFGRQFFGVPYAQAPLGDLRWKPPQPYTQQYPSEGFNATVWPPACRQLKQSSFSAVEPQAEDCLYLNIYAPPAAENQKLPVMVFIHGGAFVFGTGASKQLNGSDLAIRKNVVVVTFEYRLGPFGYLALPELQKESGGTTGNYGMQDQQMALNWVKENIGYFGGDREHYMLFGESAGAISVCLHLIANGSEGIFNNTLMESGFCTLHTMEFATDLGNDMVNWLGCNSTTDVLSCMREATADKVLNMPIPKDKIPSLNTFKWWPVVDGVVFDQDPIQAFRMGKFQKLPLVAGNNADEGSLFAYDLFPNELNVLDYIGAMFVLCNDNLVWTFEALELYPPTSLFGDNRQIATVVITDNIFACPTRRVLRVVADHGVSTNMYRFTLDPPCNVSYGPDPGSYHSGELGYVFGTGDQIECDYKSADWAISADMQDYWTTYAATGSVNGGASSFNWPQYNTKGDTNIEFTIDGLTTQSGLLKKQCDFWDKVANGSSDDWSQWLSGHLQAAVDQKIPLDGLFRFESLSPENQLMLMPVNKNRRTGSAVLSIVGTSMDGDGVLAKLEHFFSSPEFTDKIQGFMAEATPSWKILENNEEDIPLGAHDSYKKYIDVVEQALAVFLAKEGVSQEQLLEACKAAQEAQSGEFACVDYLIASTEFPPFAQLMNDFAAMSQWEAPSDERLLWQPELEGGEAEKGEDDQEIETQE